jgi:hypothetical protein
MRNPHIAAALAIMIGAGTLFGGAGPAEAAPQAFSLDTDGTVSQNLTFNQFDPSEGTLVEVEVALLSLPTDGQATAAVIGGQPGRVPANYAFTGLLGNLSLVAPDNTSLFHAGTSVSASCMLTDVSVSNCLGEGDQVDPTFTFSTVTLTTGLAAYTGLGTFDLTASIVDLLSVDTGDASHDGPFVGVVVHSSNLTWSGDVNVTFLFTPSDTSVPEPASLALFGLGTTALGLLRRRRR